MKCPVCGTENKNSYTNCYKCGAKLDKHPDTEVRSEASVIWRKDKEAFNSKRKDLVVLDDEIDHVYADPDLINRGIELPYDKDKIDNRNTGEKVRVILPRKKHKHGVHRGGMRVNWSRFIPMVVLCLGVLTGVIFGIVKLVDLSVSHFTQKLSEKRITEEAKSVPLVEKVLIDGKEWHRVTFYGNDEDVVLVDNPQRTLVIKNGSAELLLDDAGFVPEKITGTDTSVTVEINAYLCDSKGNEKFLQVEPYKIDIPISPLKLINPQDTNITTDANRVSIKIKVNPRSRVIIGDNNVTDRVDSQGYVSSSVEVFPIGVNQVPISVETPLHRINIFTLQVNRPVMEVPITLENVATDTKDGAITITGGTEPGATVTTDAALDGEISMNSSTGNFTMKVLLKRYGWNDIKITATNSGRTSTLTQRIKRTADIASYSKGAWALDFAYLSASAKALIGQVYAFTGTIVRVIDDDSGAYLLFNAGSSTEMKLLVIENETGYNLLEGKSYKLFADVSGVYEDYPLLSARYKYDIEEPTATPQVSPSPSPSGNQ